MKEWYIKSFSKLVYLVLSILVVSFAMKFLGLTAGIIIALILKTLK
jgi:hypothetical protein